MTSQYEFKQYLAQGSMPNDILNINLNILRLETIIKLEVLLTIEEAIDWLVDLSASLRVTPTQSEF